MTCSLFSARSVPLVVFIPLLVGSGCSDDAPPPAVDPTDGGIVDGGGDGAQDAAPWDGGAFSLAPPAPPALPELNPCPEGWVEVTEGRVTACRPWASDAECPVDELRFPGETSCGPLGPPCPSDGWPGDLPAGETVLFVDAEASGGDGLARDTAFGSLDDALAAAGRGTVIALRVGEYGPASDIPSGVTLHGACAAGTRIASTDSSMSSGTVDVDGAVTIRNLTVSGPRPGIWIRGSGTATLANVRVDGAEGLGVFALGGDLDGEGIWVRNTASIPDGRFGQALSIEAGAQATLSRVLVEDSHERGIFVADRGTRLSIERVHVRGTEPRPRDQIGGFALHVIEDGTAEVAQAYFVDNRASAVLVTGAGASASLTDALIARTGDAGTESAFDDTLGHGVSAQSGGQVRLTRVWLDEHRTSAAFVSGPGSSLSADQLLVTGTLAQSNNGIGGNGLTVQGEATATLAGALLAGNLEAGILLTEDAQLTASDLGVTDTSPRAMDDRFGIGIQIEDASGATLTRASIEGCHDQGIVVRDPGSSLTASDLRIVDVRARSDDRYGRALDVSRGAQLTVERATVDQSTEIGIYVSQEGSSASLMDVLIQQTRSTPGRGAAGRGLQVQRGAQLTADGLLIADNRDIGVCVAGAGSTAILGRLEIARTDRRPCAETTCSETPGGFGLAAMRDAAIQASEFRVADSSVAGVLLGQGARATLMNGEISGNAIGISNQSGAAFDEVLGEGVMLVNNERNLDSAALPIPDWQIEEIDELP